jgi:hypothetical protein
MELPKSEVRTVEVFGRKEEVPEWVNNLRLYVEYREALETFKADENRIVEKDGKFIVMIPCPNLRKVLEKHDFTKKEIEECVERQKPLYVRQGELMVMKRRAATEDGRASIHMYDSTVKKYSPMILDFLARWFTPIEVHRKMLEQGIQIRYKDILKFYRENQEKVRQLRSQTEEGWDDVSIGIKKSRLEKLSYLFNDLSQMYEKQGVQNKVQLAREMRSILEQARKEVEGEELKLTVNGKIDIEATITNYVQSTKLVQNLTIVQMAASRVAQRLGIPYGKIVDRLANSFYSKHNGFRRTLSLHETPVYPSSVNYDILDLKDVAAEEAEKQKEKVYEEVVPQKDLDTASRMKEFLLSHLKNAYNENEKK